MIEEAGCAVDYEPPVEKRGTADIVIASVARVVAVKQDQDVRRLVLAAVREFRDRFPCAKVEIDDLDEDDGSD